MSNYIFSVYVCLAFKPVVSFRAPSKSATETTEVTCAAQRYGKRAIRPAYASVRGAGPMQAAASAQMWGFGGQGAGGGGVEGGWVASQQVRTAPWGGWGLPQVQGTNVYPPPQGSFRGRQTCVGYSTGLLACLLQPG